MDTKGAYGFLNWPGDAEKWTQKADRTESQKYLLLNDFEYRAEIPEVV